MEMELQEECPICDRDVAALVKVGDPQGMSMKPLGGAVCTPETEDFPEEQQWMTHSHKRIYYIHGEE